MCLYTFTGNKGVANIANAVLLTRSKDRFLI